MKFTVQIVSCEVFDPLVFEHLVSMVIRENEEGAQFSTVFIHRRVIHDQGPKKRGVFMFSAY